MGEVSPELVERMMVHLRKCALEDIPRPNDLHRELMEIVELLPQPVDPDLVEARVIAAGYAKSGALVDRILAGDADMERNVHVAFDGIKRGRELERKS